MSVVFIIIYFNSMGTTISPCSEGVLISGVRSKATAEREMIMCPVAVQPCAFTLGPDASDTPRFIQLYFTLQTLFSAVSVHPPYTSVVHL